MSIVGAPITDSSGKGEFIVTIRASAKKGDSTAVTVTAPGKSTRWLVSIT